MIESGFAKVPNKMEQSLLIDPISSLEDERLAERALNDPEAFAVLYKRYVNRIYGYIFSRVRNVKDAEDLTHQVFYEVLKDMPKHHHWDNFVAWLFKIAKHKAIDYIRQKRVEFPIDVYNGHPDQEDAMINQMIMDESIERLNALIQTLNAEQQEMLRLRFAAGLSYREIASILNRSEGGIKMALHRLYRWLENHWEGKDDQS